MTMLKQIHKRRVDAGPWVGFLVSLVLLIWVLRAFNLAEVTLALKNAQFLYLVPVAFLVIVNFSVRATRWGILFGKDRVPRWNSLFVALMIGYLANNILPARAGEFVRAYILGQRDHIAKTTAFATIVVERVADMVIALVILALVLLFFPLPSWLGSAGILVSLVSFTALVLLVLLNVWGLRFVDWVLSWMRFLSDRWMDRARTIGSGFISGISSLRDAKRMFLFLVYTASLWLLELLVMWMIALAFQLPISWGGLLFVMLIVGLGTMVPSSPGYVGTYEFFAVNAMALIGISGVEALCFILVLHAVSILGATIIGAVCLNFVGCELNFLTAAVKE